MPNRGLQFENSIMYYSLSRIKNKTESKQKLFKIFEEKCEKVSSKILNQSKDIIGSLEPNNDNLKENFYNSFEKLSGGKCEPKTDILFIRDEEKFKCTVKYGKSVLLCSPKLETSFYLLNKVLNETLKKESTKVLYDLKQTFENMFHEYHSYFDAMDRKLAKEILEKDKKEKKLNYILQEVLGTKKNPKVSSEYLSFKFNFTKEALTGFLSFNDDDRSANYSITENNFLKIDDLYIEDIMNCSGVRLSTKGRGRDSETGLRKSSLVVRYEK